ncbi:MAG TPA: ATP-binding protein [Caldilineaceae bacterium]|nr:ATP-binding protein [Caldilineaceae bacterium]
MMSNPDFTHDSPRPSHPVDPSAPRLLAEFALPSIPGNERRIMEQVVAIVSQELVLPSRQLDRLKTAVAETAMNAMEHGNGFRADRLATVQILRAENQLIIRMTDQGGSGPIPPPPTPDLQAKLAGLQSPRGWGLFLIKHMVDELRTFADGHQHIVELVFHLEPTEPQ